MASGAQSRAEACGVARSASDWNLGTAFILVLRQASSLPVCGLGTIAASLSWLTVSLWGCMS